MAAAAAAEEEEEEEEEVEEVEEVGEVEVEKEAGRTLRRWCSSRGFRGSGRDGLSLIGEHSLF